ncbi:endonuclease/exonuclease/phosphatase family protein [Microbispora sp. NEAU-D428]|uniref:endonuclease/exonuclease/phosphatase family protein n=1 Tax=Microbispora sitophila TaxID=2771537 RepID=UPI001866B914|nr:endonuclease/exonuclease/phosphatase family protein [Microbispora sitophila]MBE3012357.1 endonuclease/exonuclease/phosphatase family protein [Microbispora sitophila]
MAESKTLAADRPRGRWAPLAPWLALIPFAGWSVLRLTGWEPKFRWSQLVSFTPYVAGASLLPLAVAVALRRWRAALAAAVVSGALGAAVLPRALPDCPARIAEGQRLRVLSANLLHGSVPVGALLDAVRRHRPDVLVMLELTEPMRDRLVAAGLKRLLPFEVSEAAPDAMGSGVFARYPLEADGSPFGWPRQVPARLALPHGGRLSVVAVHACAPSQGWRAGCWASSIRALPAAEDGTLRVLAGDFNSTLDHTVLRELIATGYRDAADATGKGLAPTWPYLGQPWFIPKVAIDHVLADRRIAVDAFMTLPLPGTDHRATLTDLIVPREDP